MYVLCCGVTVCVVCTFVLFVLVVLEISCSVFPPPIVSPLSARRPLPPSPSIKVTSKLLRCYTLLVPFRPIPLLT